MDFVKAFTDVMPRLDRIRLIKAVHDTSKDELDTSWSEVMVGHDFYKTPLGLKYRKTK